MRVTDNMMFSAGMTAMQNQQQILMQAQSQSSSGMRIEKPSDDPSGAYRNLLYSSDLSSVQSLQKTTDLASQRLSQGDTAIGVVQNSMEQAYELAMQFSYGTAGNNPDILKSSASSALSLYQNIVTAANTSMNGIPLFGGGRTGTPFDETHLVATPVQVQSNGTGPLSSAPSGFVASVGDFQAPANQPVGKVTTEYQIAPSAVVTGGYDVTINGVAQAVPVMPTAAPQAGMPDILDLGNGVTYSLGGAPLAAGTALAFTVVPDGAHFKATPSQLLVGGAPATVDVSTAFSAQVAPGSAPAGMPLGVKVAYQASSNSYDVDINGVPQTALQPKDGNPPYLDLGNGVTLNLVGKPKVGDVFYFEVVPGYQGGQEDRPIQVASGQTLPGNVSGAELVEGKGSLGNNINILRLR